jgi:hypothetical protein
MSKSTVLRFLEAKNLEELTMAVGLLPFKIEFKQILESKSRVKLVFTLSDEQSQITNEMLKQLTGL